MQIEKYSPAQADTAPVKMQHNLILEDRSRLTATGITKIISCDDTGAVLEIQQGLITLGGRGFNVSELSTKSGELRISGKIDFVQYSGKTSDSHAGFFRKLMR